MPYLTAAGLERLKNYRYGSALNGFVDRVIMTPWWNFLINFFPTWLAPNLMTLLALMHTALAYALLQYLAFYQEGPRWVYFLSAYCFFGYQTLDALDGKQARRVGASSPLGQLFDHGCDSICAVFSGFIVSAALQTGVSWTTVGVMYAHMLPFFSSNWECAHTDHMRFGAIGVTEAQFSIMGVLIATGIWGTQLWSYTVMGLELRMIVLIVCGSIAVLHTISSVQMVAKHYADRGEDPSEAWSQLREFSVLCVLTFSLFCAPSPHYWRSHEDFAMLLMLVGLLFSYLVTRLIVCHVTGMKFGHWHQILTPLPLLVVNSFGRYLIGNYILCEPILLTAYVTVIVGMYAHFIYFVIDEIATALNIRVLTLDPDRAKKD